MRLLELSFACYVYQRMSGYDKTLRQFKENTKPIFDIGKSEHRIELLKWLNNWGCRQFAKKYYELASEEIKCWYQECNHLLFSKDKNLLTLTEVELNLISEAFSNLKRKLASKRRLENTKVSEIKIGPTGAAKILFILRPKALIPWDESIRKRKGFDGSSASYENFLIHVRNMLEQIRESCLENGFHLLDLPRVVGRSESSPVKIIDEYFWVTITRDCPVPKLEDLNRWTTWK